MGSWQAGTVSSNRSLSQLTVAGRTIWRPRNVNSCTNSPWLGFVGVQHWGRVFQHQHQHSRPCGPVAVVQEAQTSGGFQHLGANSQHEKGRAALPSQQLLWARYAGCRCHVASLLQLPWKPQIKAKSASHKQTCTMWKGHTSHFYSHTSIVKLCESQTQASLSANYPTGCHRCINDFAQNQA